MAILECRELTKYFDSSLALDHVSLTVEPGATFGRPAGSAGPASGAWFFSSFLILPCFRTAKKQRKVIDLPLPQTLHSGR